ncbi:MAG: hypothetical protein JWR14_2563 [Caballeronia sp.]|nr:hypothetical protein [Caballeronia sp.]
MAISLGRPVEQRTQKVPRDYMAYEAGCFWGAPIFMREPRAPPQISNVD